MGYPVGRVTGSVLVIPMGLQEMGWFYPPMSNLKRSNSGCAKRWPGWGKKDVQKHGLQQQKGRMRRRIRQTWEGVRRMVCDGTVSCALLALTFWILRVSMYPCKHVFKENECQWEKVITNIPNPGIDIKWSEHDATPRDFFSWPLLHASSASSVTMSFYTTG